MNERTIQNNLWRLINGGSSVVVPNFTPSRWFECDLFSVSKAGYWTEHEIKMTVKDFKADADKKQSLWRVRRDDEPGNGVNIKEEVAKHDLLAACDERGPSVFWYVLSTDVARAVEIPQWAGLKVVAKSANHTGLNFNVMKPAPKLHRMKASESLIDQAKTAMYWRYWRMRLGHKEPKEMEHDHGREDQGDHQSVHE